MFTYVCRGDELLLTEMIFNGAFNDLTIEQCVSLLSCFVFQEKVCDYIMLPAHSEWVNPHMQCSTESLL